MMESDRFIGRKNDLYYPICNRCIYKSFGNKCKAFPHGIPEEILTGEFDHTKKHPKQKNDVLFEPIGEKDIRGKG